MADAQRAAAMRLFLALWPPPAIRHALADLQAQWQWPAGAARVQPERLHLTLHFIGSVPAEQVPSLGDALAVGFEPHVLGLERGACKVWPGGIAVLELEAAPPLLRLHAALADALGRAGLPVEKRRFRPHVTFARRATGATPPADLPQLEWHAADGYALVRSIPGRGYETLHAFR